MCQITVLLSCKKNGVPPLTLVMTSEILLQIITGAATAEKRVQYFRIHFEKIYFNCVFDAAASL